MTDNCYYQVDATLFSFQRSLSIHSRLSSPWISFQPGSPLDLEVSGCWDWSFLALQKRPISATMTIRFGCVSRIFALLQYSRVRGVKTGGRKSCGGPTCFAPLFKSLYRTDLLVHPAVTMRSSAGNLESLPSGCLNTSFTFVPTIVHNTPHKEEMQQKSLFPSRG
jgi:hypothetical protein